MIEHNDQGAAPTGESWLIIFADLLSLLLTFFVLMFSMSSVQVSKWEAVVQSLSENLNLKRAFIQDQNWKQIDAALTPREEALSLPYLKKIFEDKLGYNPVLRRSRIALQGERLVISLPTYLIFEKGEAVFSESAGQALQELAMALMSLNNRITVVGHTDPKPVDSPHYANNWQLSLGQALSVGRLIEQAGYGQPVEILGNGPSRFDELDEKMPLHERYLLAQRVDIILHRENKDQPLAVGGDNL